ncbi:serine/arginine repetitive matrix protein 1-like [Homalodisca vitripennis]|uniref:serine/arginine repetitive matrix protein 1-like n=1 Tax=Homalodisca vitripennis TaxID=197043 RepID=UPI001EEB0BE6|nr:serine/arginine repetitive matrix protein 1-like [Homalodisca vitripennis]
MKRQHRIMVPEAFKVLPPLSPELPAPPRAPAPHRVAPPVSRREKTAFVILNDERPPPSRGTSPSGRVSPFRGRGFREETSRHASREPSPSPETARKNPPRSRSRSRLPVAAPRTQNGTSTSSSPVRGNASGIPKPVNRRNSLSPNRAAQVINQNNRNKALTSPNHPVKSSNKTGIQSPQHVTKAIISSKRVGPTNSVRNGNSVATKPPLPRANQPAQKETEKKNNLTSPYRRRPQPNKPDVTRSPSRIPRTRSISRGRVANVRPSSPHTSPQRALVRHSPRVQAKINGEKKKTGNGSNGENKTSPSGEIFHRKC